MKTILIASQFSSIHSPGAEEKLRNYIQCLRAHPSNHVLISSQSPDTGKMIDQADGLLLTGGGDIPGHFWGDSSSSPAHSASENRTAFEIALIQKMHSQKKPILGICLGAQMINVAFGGTLVKDLCGPGQAERHNRKKDGSSALHPIMVHSPSKLSEVLPAQTIVNSRHHQAIARPAEGFIISAQSEDHVTEAIELDDDDFWLIGVQWHPEDMTENPSQMMLFEKFIEACG